MSHTLQPRGRVEVLSLPARSRRELFVARYVDELLRSGEPAASVLVVCDCSSPDSIRELICRRSGRRRTRLLSVSSTFRFLQSLQRPSVRIPPTVRARLTYACASLAREHGIDIRWDSGVDDLLLNEPSHPASAAYLAGLSTLGYCHPYTLLDSLSIPISVRYVMHPDLSALPPALTDWFLRSVAQGINIVTLSPCPEGSEDTCGLTVRSNPPASSDSLLHEKGGGSVLTRIASPVGRHSALIDAARSGRYRLFVFESDLDMRRFQLACIASSSPLSNRSRSNILFSPSLRLLYLLLEWLVADSEGSVETVFGMLDGVRTHWRNFARAEGLPVDLERALGFTVHKASESEVQSVRLVAALATLRSEFILSESDDARLRLIETFSFAYACSSLTSDLSFICDFVVASGIYLRELYLSLTRAWAAPASEAPVLVGPFDPRPSVSGDWLFVPDPSRETDSIDRLPDSLPVPTAVFALKEARTHG